MVSVPVFIAAAALALSAAPVAAGAASPAGFYEANRLEPAASFVAGKPVTVMCSTSKAAFAASNPRLSADGGGYVLPDDLTTLYVRSDACALLHAWLNHRHAEEYDFASAALLLAHESTHLRGVVDEGETECAALAKLPTMLRRFFPPGKRTTVAMLMMYARDSHDRTAPAYHTGTCG